MLSKEEYTELFEIKVRGVCAAAFLAQDIAPTLEHMSMLRGKREITMRDIGEIGYSTGCNFKLDLYRRETTETEDD